VEEAMIHDPVGLIEQLTTDNARLREQLRIATEALEYIAGDGDTVSPWVMADDALTRMSVVE
jgi:hypothetical protein